MTLHKTDIIFIKVADNKAKLKLLCDGIKHHFMKGERVLVSVSGHEAASYVDDLLWRLPEEGFLPHHVIDKPCAEYIAITTGIANINNATVLFNLKKDAHSTFEQFTTLYEFYDETHPDKTALSQRHLEAYPRHRFL